MAGSDVELGTLILTGSQPMSPHTCLAYSSSIQGSSSPHQSVARVPNVAVMAAGGAGVVT